MTRLKTTIPRMRQLHSYSRRGSPRKRFPSQTLPLLFKLPSLQSLLLNFFKDGKRIKDGSGAYADPAQRQFTLEALDVWFSVRMQLCATQDKKIVLPPVTVTASPPSTSEPFGLCNFVLVRDPEGAEITGIQGALVMFLRDNRPSHLAIGHYVAQLRLIFRPASDPKQKRLSSYYAYIQPFEPAGSTVTKQMDGTRAHVTDDNIEMFRVVRRYTGNRRREGRIIRLTDIWRPIELIPVYGKKCPRNWNSSNAVESAKEFYVNSFLGQRSLPMHLLAQ